MSEALVQKIKNDLDNARKEQNKYDTIKLSVLYSEAVSIGKNNGNRESTDSEVSNIIEKFVKNLRSNIELAPSKANEFQKEIDLYSKYLPKQLTESEIQDILLQYKNENTDFQIGNIMKFFMQNFKGQYDSKLLSGLVNKIK